MAVDKEFFNSLRQPFLYPYFAAFLTASATTSATSLFSAGGITKSALNSSGLTRLAIAFAAASFISVVISFTLASNAPLNIPGNTNTLFIWFGKSDLPVPTTFAPAFFARSGIISGVGFAIAKIIASLFIDWTIASLTIPGAETPINISAFTNASFNKPFSLFGFVLSDNLTFASSSFCVSGSNIPSLSQTTIFLAPASSKRYVIAYGPHEVASIALIKDNNFGCVLTDLDSYESKKNKIISAIETYNNNDYTRQWNYVQEYYDKDKVSKMLLNDMKEIVEKHKFNNNI